MKVSDFVKEFKDNKIFNSKVNDHAISDYLKEHLEIKTYIPFKMKRALVETVVLQNIKLVDGIKKIDPINEYIGFIVAILSVHTNLEFSQDPIADYDLIAENGLLPLIVAEFQESYSECDTLLKMARASELEDNNVNAIVARFTTGILDRVDAIGEVLKNKFGDFDLKDILGTDFNQEDLNKLSSFLDKYK